MLKVIIIQTKGVVSMTTIHNMAIMTIIHTTVDRAHLQIRNRQAQQVAAAALIVPYVRSLHNKNALGNNVISMDVGGAVPTSRVKMKTLPVTSPRSNAALISVARTRDADGRALM